VAYFASSHDQLRGIREAVGVPRREELREAARQMAAGEGAGVEDVVLANDRPVPIVAQQVMTWLGWA
jgi:hypothetical protein